jgi:hypothetical protein
VSLRDAVDDEKRKAAEARAAASKSADDAKTAEEVAAKAEEDASADEEMAATAEEGAKKAMEKAEAARKEFASAQVQAQEAARAARTAAERLEAMRREAGVTTKSKASNPSLADNAAKEAAEAASLAEAEATNATANEDLASQRATTFRIAANRSAAEAAVSRAECVSALKKAADTASLASVQMYRKALHTAISIDNGGLHQLIERWALTRLRETGGASICAYAATQPLVICQKDTWTDVTVRTPPPVNARGEHMLTTVDGKELTLALHAWNHAPVNLVQPKFEQMRQRHVRLRLAPPPRRHRSSHVIDAPVHLPPHMRVLCGAC